MKTKLYAALKVLNSLLATFWGIAFTAVLVRRFGVDFVSHYIMITAIGSYVLVADLGLSSVIYVNLRREFLAGEELKSRYESVISFLAYLAIALVSTIIFAIVMPQISASMRDDVPNSVMYFLFWVLALPWSIVRVTAGAIEKFLYFEFAEFVRRAILTVLLLLIPFGLELRTFLIVANIAWFVWILGIGYMTSKWLRLTRIDKVAMIQAGQGLYGKQLHTVGYAAVFSLCEFVIYTYPYFFVRSLYGNTSLIVFDIFYKTFRFGAVWSRIASESLLPQQTRALSNGDFVKLKKLIGAVLVLGIAAIIPAELILLFFHAEVFRLVFGDKVIIPQSIVLSMGLMLILVVVQATGGSLLVGVGRFRELSRLSVMVLVSMGGLTIASAYIPLSLQHFTLGYVIIYGIGAVAYLSLAYVLLVGRPSIQGKPI